MTQANFAPDYVQVNERIVAFKKEFPQGCLQSEIVTLTDKLVVVKGIAYRTPYDQKPGIGHSSLEIPGKTPYTRGSELENAETSAWGRALAALGYEVKRGIASKEEVDNKKDDAPAAPSGTAPAPYRPTFRPREAQNVKSLEPTLLRVADIKSFTGTNKNGKPYTKFTITTTDGQKFSTFSESFMQDAAYAKDNELDVAIAFHTGQYGNDIDSLTVPGVFKADPSDPTLEAPRFDEPVPA